MSRSSAKSGKAKATKSLKEKWDRSVQLVAMNREKEIGVSHTITQEGITQAVWDGCSPWLLGRLHIPR